MLSRVLSSEVVSLSYSQLCTPTHKHIEHNIKPPSKAIIKMNTETIAGQCFRNTYWSVFSYPILHCSLVHVLKYHAVWHNAPS